MGFYHDENLITTDLTKRLGLVANKAVRNQMEKPMRNLMDQPMMIRRAQTMMIGWEMRFRRVPKRTIKERGKYLQTLLQEMLPILRSTEL
jgi:hypothetical protein